MAKAGGAERVRERRGVERFHRAFQGIHLRHERAQLSQARLQQRHACHQRAQVLLDKRSRPSARSR